MLPHDLGKVLGQEVAQLGQLFVASLVQRAQELGLELLVALGTTTDSLAVEQLGDVGGRTTAGVQVGQRGAHVAGVVEDGFCQRVAPGIISDADDWACHCSNIPDWR